MDVKVDNGQSEGFYNQTGSVSGGVSAGVVLECR